MTDKAPVLDVRNLKTHFFTRAGVVKAVDGVDLYLRQGEILGLVGESGSGKSITGFSLMGLLDEPGRIVEGAILFDGEDLRQADAKRWRALRGEEMAMIFQDPMMTLNPVLRVDTQMVETVLAHHDVSRSQAVWAMKNDVRYKGRPDQTTLAQNATLKK
jgi:peptide/nickel transport system ATP-binding protein